MFRVTPKQLAIQSSTYSPTACFETLFQMYLSSTVFHAARFFSQLLHRKQCHQGAHTFLMYRHYLLCYPLLPHPNLLMYLTIEMVPYITGTLFALSLWQFTLVCENVLDFIPIICYKTAILAGFRYNNNSMAIIGERGAPWLHSI